MFTFIDISGDSLWRLRQYRGSDPYPWRLERSDSGLIVYLYFSLALSALRWQVSGYFSMFRQKVSLNLAECQDIGT